MLARGIYKFCPRCRIRRHPTHKVISSFHPFVERQTAGLFEYLWRVVYLCVGSKFKLRYGANVPLHNIVNSATNKGCSHIHQFIVNIFSIISVEDFHFFAMQHQSGVNFVIQQESSHSSLLLSIDNCPVDGGCATILGQKRGVEIEGAMRWHIPHHFR